MIVLARHGETEWSASGKHTSTTDLPLTGRGQAAARALGQRLAGRTFALVLASPLQRAVETARLAGFDPEIEPDLTELAYGPYEGRTTAEIREERPGWDIWDDGVAEGETVDEVAERADRVIARARRVRGDVALVGHAHLLRVLGARWIGLPPTAGRHLTLEPASWCLLGWERETPAILAWNVPALTDH